MPTKVPAHGPYDADVLFVGEAPGATEVRRRQPFVGATGQAVRRALREGGLDDVDNVRWCNVIPYNPGTLTVQRRNKLTVEHWGNIDIELVRCRPKVIVACGGAALLRLTGLTDITAEWGGVLESHECAQVVELLGKRLETRIPEDCVVIPCMHPAGIMRSDLRSEWVQCKRTLLRVARWAGADEFVRSEPEITHVGDWNWAVLDAAWSQAREVTIDTEFDPESHVPFLVGVAFDHEPGHVYSCRPESDHVVDVLKSRMAGDRLHIAHYHPAEVQSLRRLGVDVRWAPDMRWWDTLIAFSCLYSDSEKSLSYVARHYLDDVRNWKHMSHDDPVYNAIDVRNTQRVFELQRQEIAEEGMWELLQDECMPTMGLLWEIEHVGLQVDEQRQRQEIDKATSKIASLSDDVAALAETRFERADVRVKRSTKEFEALLCEHVMDVECELHPAYTGVRAKRWATSDLCVCKLVYERAGQLVERAPLRPFNPGNNHDLRWMLYDKEGFGLPVQKSREGSPTANATAIERLCQQLERNRDNKRSKYYRKDGDADEVIEFMRAVKQIQHAQKMLSTFLRPPVDEDGVAHPPINMWGAGSGRPSSGADEATADKRGSQFVYNALNVPKEARGIFVPRRLV